MMSSLHPRGLTLLVSIILTSVILSVSLALFDITYKQVVLASSAKQSQIAFYAADTALECVLYWDQQKDAFDYNATTYLSSGITCNNLTIVPANAPNSTTQDTSAGIRTTVLYILNASGGTTGKVTIYKKNTGATTIFANGYSTGNTTDPRRIERGLTVTYGS